MHMMHGSKKISSVGIQLFLVEEGSQHTTISGSSSAASKTQFKWRFVGVPMMA